MDFYKVIGFLIKDFERYNVSYALMGGFAMGAYGIVRATTDLDFLIAVDDLDAVKKIMHDHGYRCIYESENVSQFMSDLKPFGAVDFLHAFRPVSKEMLERKKDIPVFEGGLTLSVLTPEDIVGLSKIMKSGSGNGKGNGPGDTRNEETHPNSGADADALNRDFRILEENRKKLDAELSFDDYITFVTEVNAFAGHPQKKFRPITGEFKI